MSPPPLTTTMRERLARIARSKDRDGNVGVLAFEYANFSHMTDKALRRRGLVTIKRVMRWWVIEITDEGKRALMRVDDSCRKSLLVLAPCAAEPELR